MTEGSAADCEVTFPLMEGMDAEALLADGAYDTLRGTRYGGGHPPKRAAKRGGRMQSTISLEA